MVILWKYFSRSVKQQRFRSNSNQYVPVCAGLWKKNACLCSVSSLISIQIYFFFPSLCLFDLLALHPWAELDFSKAQPGFWHLWLVLWPFSVAQEVRDLSHGGVGGRIALLNVNITAGWEKQSCSIGWRLTKDPKGNALCCIKLSFSAHEENIWVAHTYVHRWMHMQKQTGTVAMGV